MDDDGEHREVMKSGVEGEECVFVVYSMLFVKYHFDSLNIFLSI